MSTSINISRDASGDIIATEKADVPVNVDGTQQPQGGVRVNTGARVRTGGESIRAIFGDGDDAPVLESHTQQSVNVVASQKSAMQEANPGVLGSALNHAGRPVALGPNSDPNQTTVEVNGMRTSLAVALNKGYVVRNAETGGYLAGEGYATNPDQAPQNAGPEFGQVPEVQQLVSDSMAGLPELRAQRILTKMLTGETLSNADRSAFEAAGIDPEAGAQRIDAAASAIVQGLKFHIGLDIGDTSQDGALIDTLMAMRPERLQDGVRHAIHGSYDVLVKYLRGAVGELDRAMPLHGSDYPTRTTADGKQLVTVPGVGELQVSVAKRLGYL